MHNTPLLGWWQPLVAVAEALDAAAAGQAEDEKRQGGSIVFVAADVGG